MRFRDWDRPAAPGTADTVSITVTKCPFCESQRVTTTGNAGLSSTYWRCHACSEIWNPNATGVGAAPSEMVGKRHFAAGVAGGAKYVRLARTRTSRPGTLIVISCVRPSR